MAEQRRETAKGLHKVLEGHAGFARGAVCADSKAGRGYRLTIVKQQTGVHGLSGSAETLHPAPAVASDAVPRLPGQDQRNRIIIEVSALRAAPTREPAMAIPF
jgi:hypothetical protein